MTFSFTSLRATLRGAQHLLLAAGVALLFLAAGCATENTSDLPWNTPQSWEGSVTVPGFNQGN